MKLYSVSFSILTKHHSICYSLWRSFEKLINNFNSIILATKFSWYKTFLLIIFCKTSVIQACLGGSVGRDSAHQPGLSVRGAGVHFPGSTGRFRVQISGAHVLRLLSRAGKEGSTVSSIICDRPLVPLTFGPGQRCEVC